MKLPSLFFVALAALFVFAPDGAHAQEKAKPKPKAKDVTGTVFRDPNKNGRLDPKEKGGVASTVWLYRVMPNGTRRKIRKIQTNAVGQYVFKRVPFGRYFLAFRFGPNKLAVRTGVFRVGPRTNSTRNIPYATAQTLKNYKFLSPTPNPDNLDKDNPPVSPYSP